MSKPKGHVVNKSAREILRHWTPDRRARARANAHPSVTPLSLPKNAKGPAAFIGPRVLRGRAPGPVPLVAGFPVPNSMQYPFSAVGLLYADDDPEGLTSIACTGTIINGRYVLTAANVVWNGQTQAMRSNFMFVPGAPTNLTPYVPTRIWMSPDYVPAFDSSVRFSAIKYDYALLELPYDLTPSNGCIGIQFGVTSELLVDCVGFPYSPESQYNQFDVMYCSGCPGPVLQSYDGSSSGDFNYIECDYPATGPQGAPWLISPSLLPYPATQPESIMVGMSTIQTESGWGGPIFDQTFTGFVMPIVTGTEG